MITIQPIRVRWTAAGRGARAANTRRGLDRPVTLPASLPNAEVVVHEVLADEAVGYRHHAEVLTGKLQRASDVGLWLGFEGAAVIVQRLPGSAAYPPPRRPARLFTLQPGQVGRYKANFRFTGCACNPSWYYESWTVHIGNGGMARNGLSTPARTTTSTTAFTSTAARCHRLAVAVDGRQAAPRSAMWIVPGERLADVGTSRQTARPGPGG